MGILDASEPEPPMTVEVVKADGKKEVVDNPLHDRWVAKDQQVLSYFFFCR